VLSFLKTSSAARYLVAIIARVPVRPEHGPLGAAPTAGLARVHRGIRSCRGQWAQLMLTPEVKETETRA
jgi:hypothetical protein